MRSQIPRQCYCVIRAEQPPYITHVVAPPYFLRHSFQTPGQLEMNGTDHLRLTMTSIH